jgi:uncharacterized RDD family membrane protein YckC
MMSPDANTASGVYYRTEDYLGVTRRLLIDLIDLTAAFALSALVVAAGWATGPYGEHMPAVTLFLCAAVWFSYFVLLKRSRFRTLGYRVAGARIVNLRGSRPSILSLFGRLLFAFVGPLNFLLDLFWLTGDANRQALRDKFAGTYVVREDASPAGAGAIAIRTYMFWGMTFLFREVKRR